MSSQPNPNIGMFRDTHLWKMGYKELQRMNANYERIVDRYLELQRLIDRLRADGKHEEADEIVRYMRAKVDLKRLIREVQETLDDE